MKRSGIIRQGDVGIFPAGHPEYQKPKGKLSPVKPESGLLILMRGEATGHHHSVPATTATLSLDEGGVMYLTVEELTQVSHQEHAALDLAPGEYLIKRQREWTDADEPRAVMD